MNHVIDIVVPVYNAYNYTEMCIESIIKNTEFEYRLLLINDCSTDDSILPLLKRFQTENSNIVVIDNESNLGFVGTVNKGMKYSQNDVVLLNSDTEVTSGWLKKLHHCAYQHHGIATVTPLTNNGTVCSVPNFLEDNDLPSSMNLEEYAALIEKTSLKIYPDLPTAVGFCMYIKRTVLDEVGFFNEEVFGKGYGEENDFCCRALELGYTHVLCDDTFIYHKGSMSFSSAKAELVEANAKQLNHLHPYYDPMVHRFIAKKPLEPIIENIKLQWYIHNGRKNVLYVLHNDFMLGCNHPIGGTEFHVKDIIDNLEEINAVVVCVKEQDILVHFYSEGEFFAFSVPHFSMIEPFAVSSHSYKSKMTQIINFFHIDLIHIQHLRTHTVDIASIAQKDNIPYFVTLHDFASICPHINLLNLENVYCNLPNEEVDCNPCFQNIYKSCQGFESLWNSRFYSLLNHAQKVFVPSQAAKDILSKRFDSLYQNHTIRLTVREHGVDSFSVSKKSRGDGVFRIASIGGLVEGKGSKIIYELISTSKRKNVEWHLFGEICDVGLEGLYAENVFKHGKYKREDIVGKLTENKIDLVCILSIWPETYSYTLSEAIVAGIPILATDIGALGERVKSYRCGWTVPLNTSIPEISALIDKIIEDKKDYKEKMVQVENTVLPTKKEIAQLYYRDYLEHISCEISREALDMDVKYGFVYQFMKFRSAGGQVIWNEDYKNQMEHRVCLLNEEIDSLKYTLHLRNMSLSYRTLAYLARKLPFLRPISRGILAAGVKIKNVFTRKSV